MRKIKEELNDQLLYQDFDEIPDQDQQLYRAQLMAKFYAEIENAVAVLSDLEADKSHVYYGKFAHAIGINSNNSDQQLETIWEEEIFSKIHPDDLLQKHSMELYFFHQIKKLPQENRANYYVDCSLRMKDNLGIWIPIRHRMFYLCNAPKGSIWLALCLYQFDNFNKIIDKYQGQIVNSATGEIIPYYQLNYKNILTKREIEILSFIKNGKSSQSIADILSISLYTINRHRQNILEKLKVKNSHQACRMAESLKLI